MPDLTPSDIAFQNAGKYLRWVTQETGSTATNGTPTAGNSGVSVLGSQRAKIAVTPNSGATLSFRVWIEYEGRQGFYLADGFERSNVATAWTQEINTSGASRLYVEVTSIDTGNFDVDIAPAEIPDGQLQRVRKITDWSDAGTGVAGEYLIWENASGQEALFEWDDTAQQWYLESTGNEWFLVEDWSSGTLNTDLWLVDTDTGDATIDSVNNRVELTVTSGGSERYVLFLQNDVRLGTQIRYEASLNSLATPTTGNILAFCRFEKIDGLTDNNWPLVNSLLEIDSGGPIWRFRWTDDVGSTTNVNSFSVNSADEHEVFLSTYDLVGKDMEFQAALDVLGGSNVIAPTSGTNNLLGAHYGEEMETKLQLFNNGADVAGSVWIGRIWLRR